MNCGAVIDIEQNKCPYCGTSYFDFTAIDFESCTPVFLKFKTKLNGQEVIFTQKAVPELREISMSEDRVDYMGYKDNRILSSVVKNRGVKTDVTFSAVPFKCNNQDVYFTMKIDNK